MSSPPRGHVAEWLRNGLQNRVHQFNSGRGLHQHHQIVAESFLGKALVMPRPRLDGAAAREGLPQADRWAARNVHVKSRLGRRDRSRFLRRRCFLQNLTVAITRLRRSFYCADASWLAKALTSELAAARSAGGVPALGKRQQRPGQPIVVGGFRRLIEYRLIAQEVLLGRGRNGRSYGIQQQIEFSFAHRALLRFERVGSQNSFVSGLSEWLKLYRSGNRGRLGYGSVNSRSRVEDPDRAPV